MKKKYKNKYKIKNKKRTVKYIFYYKNNAENENFFLQK